MNPGLSGLMPSAMKPTFTPLPSIHSAAAVLAFGSDERALMVCSASGSSSGWAGSLEQAAGSTGEGVAAAGVTARGLADVALEVPADDGGATETRRSGVTDFTAGSLASARTWAAVTVAAKALTRPYCLRCWGLGPASRCRTADWLTLPAVVRALSAERLAGVFASWSRRTTMTACDFWAAVL